MKIYVTGDTHGNQNKWLKEIDSTLKKGDILIVCGDFGVGFWDGRFFPEEMFYDYLSEKEYNVLFVDGNHEDFDKLNSYKVEMWCGGKVHKIRDNIIHLMRGEVFNIDGNTIFVMGGGYSLDKERRTEGYDWWPQEMPTEEEYDNALTNLSKVDNKVDYIITHTAPFESIYYLSTIRSFQIKGYVREEMPLTFFLDEIQKSVEYKHWYFGHFHIEYDLWKNQTALISSIRELQTGKIVHNWLKYE